MPRPPVPSLYSANAQVAPAANVAYGDAINKNVNCRNRAVLVVPNFSLSRIGDNPCSAIALCHHSARSNPFRCRLHYGSEGHVGQASNASRKFASQFARIQSACTEAYMYRTNAKEDISPTAPSIMKKA
eukprot:COSAG03_NODE_762_length_5962_cov_4.714481_10_plen_129_part_00